MSNEPTNLGPYFAEFEAEIKTVADNAAEAAQADADGDLQRACDVVNVMHYKTTGVEDLRLNLLKMFSGQGYELAVSADAHPWVGARGTEVVITGVPATMARSQKWPSVKHRAQGARAGTLCVRNSCPKSPSHPTQSPGFETIRG